jgi:hypothetical protein
MKNTKAIFLIILGSFLMATGFAYAEQETAFETLKRIAGDSAPVAERENAADIRRTPLAAGQTKGVALAVKAAAVPPASAAAPAPEEKKPSVGEKVKEFVGDNFGQIVSAIAIGFLCALTFGGAGIGLLAGVAAFGLSYGMAKL